jgi:predicted porin
MQKKLLGLAVAGALAAPGLALAQVEIYGFVNMSVGKVKYDAPTQFTQTVAPPGGTLATAPSTAGVGSVSKWDVQSYASNYGIRGRENVGGGMTAWFQIEQNAPMERSNNIAITPASRNSAVGLQSGWGNVFIGQWTTPWADLDALWGVGTVGGLGPITSIIGRRETTGTAPNPNCANGHTSPAAGICDAVEAGGGVGHPFWRRASQALFYQSPVFAGVQIKLMYQTNEGKSNVDATGTPNAGPTQVTADPSMWSASAQWAGMGGRVRVGAAFDAHKDFTAQGKTDNGWRVTGGWNFGFADVGLAYEAMTYKTPTGDCDARQYGVQVAIPVGQGAIRGAYSIAKDIKGDYTSPIPTGTAATAAAQAAALYTTTGSCGFAPAQAGFDTSNNGAKQWNLGYEYRFSKRTTVGFGYAAIDNDEAAVFTWTGMPPTQGGGGAGVPSTANTPMPGSDPSMFFVNMVHRF